MAALADIVAFCDEYLKVSETPDYPPALNGLQVAGPGEVRRIAAAVDLSLRAIRAAVDGGAELLLVHHGIFWGGLRPLTGAHFTRVEALMQAKMGVYSSHLPLDRHPAIGNNILLARELGLKPEAGFAKHDGIEIGLRGNGPVRTDELMQRARRFSESCGGTLRHTPFDQDRITKSWAICTGAGADANTLGEAASRKIDTLIVGEGPHWTAVEAEEQNLVILYAGHYATETLGVSALARTVAEKFGVEWFFVDAPTGL